VTDTTAREITLKVLIGELPEDVEAVHYGVEVPDVVSYVSTGEQTALSKFYYDLLLGRPVPLAFYTSEVGGVDTMLAISLFLHRDLAVNPKFPALVAAADLVERLSVQGMAHIDRDLARFLKFLRVYLPPSGLSKREQGSRLQMVMTWIREFVMEDKLPNMPVEPEPPRVIDTGTNGFVMAEAARGADLYEGWVELYREGFLRGVLFSPPVSDRRKVLVARKSHFLEFDLRQAAEVFNEGEKAMGEPAGWVMPHGSDWLEGPEGGTLLLVSVIRDVLCRV